MDVVNIFVHINTSQHASVRHSSYRVEDVVERHSDVQNGRRRVLPHWSRRLVVTRVSSVVEQVLFDAVLSRPEARRSFIEASRLLPTLRRRRRLSVPVGSIANVGVRRESCPRSAAAPGTDGRHQRRSTTG